jgi:hypothetical protein
MPALDLQTIGSNGLVPGLTAIGFYAAHFWQWARSRRLENILWACHIGCLLVGIGWLIKSPLLNGIGLLWLMPGIFFWLLYLLCGGVFLWSSLFIHIGGNLLGLWGAALLGLPRGTWWKAGLGYIALLLVSRRFSRTSENVNFSRQVWTGWEKRFPSYQRYISGLVLGAFVMFFALEQLLRLCLAASK